MDLLWKRFRKMAVDWQRWNSVVYPKGGALWKKSYAECIEWRAWYYSFWVFKSQSDICSQQLQRIHEILLRKNSAFVSRETLYFSLITPYSARIMQDLVGGSIASTIFPKPCAKWFPPFSFSTKCSEWQTIFLKSDENVYWKLAEFYPWGINKLPVKWREMIQNKGKYTIDWNKFIVKLFVNKLYFTKMKIFCNAIIYIYIYI